MPSYALKSGHGVDEVENFGMKFKVGIGTVVDDPDVAARLALHPMFELTSEPAPLPAAAPTPQTVIAPVVIHAPAPTTKPMSLPAGPHRQRGR